MSLYIWDTDHLSLHQRDPGLFQQRLNAIPADKLAITVITVEEQLRGRFLFSSCCANKKSASKPRICESPQLPSQLEGFLLLETQLISAKCPD
jgi:hypothetical protein